jgi:hypothetical protein
MVVAVDQDTQEVTFLDKNSNAEVRSTFPLPDAFADFWL